MIEIKTFWNGVRAWAECNGLEIEGENQAHALSKMVNRLRRRKTSWGEEWRSTPSGISGVFTKPGRKPKPPEQAGMDI